MGQKDSGSEMKELLKKLSSWSKERQESQRLLDNLLSSYSGRFDKGIDALTEEVGDLKAQLSVVTKERNYLHETNKKLGSEIRQQRDKFALFKNLLELENEENYNKDNQDMDSPEGNISDSEEEDLGETRIISEADDLEEKEQYDFVLDEINLSSDEFGYVNFNESEEVTEDMGAESDPDGKENVKQPTDQNHSPKAGNAVVISVIKASKSVLSRDINDAHDKTRKHFCHFCQAPKFVCDECGYSTNIKSRLVDHVNSVHLKINNESGNESEDTSPRPDVGGDVCDKCGYSTNIKNRLVEHVNNVHLKINNEPSGTPKTSKTKRKAEMQSTSTPKRINLSIEGKREIIRKYDSLPKMSIESAAEKLNLPKSSLWNILSKRKEIFAAPKGEMKRSRVGNDAMVENYLMRWFDTVSEKHAKITHEILRAKAEELAKKLGHDEFKASSGWLTRLLKRRDISHKKQHGEGKSSDFQGRKDWLKDVWGND